MATRIEYKSWSTRDKTASHKPTMAQILKDASFVHREIRQRGFAAEYVISGLNANKGQMKRSENVFPYITLGHAMNILPNEDKDN